MPSSARHNPLVARKKGRAGGSVPSCAAPKLRDSLERIAGRIAEADQRHGSALAEIEERLSHLGHKVDGVRAGFAAPDAGALERIEDGIDMLSGQIAHLGRRRPWARLAGGAGRTVPRASSRPSTGAEAEWDAEAAEALTRVYEKAEADLRKPPRAARAGKRSEPEAPIVPPPHEPWQGEEPDRAWLEARLAGIDGLLRRALEGVDPERTLDAVKGRLDQFEVRFDAALQTVARRSDLEGLKLLETQLNELTRQFEETRGQLARLDSIDAGLRDLALGLDARRSVPAAVDSRAIETMIDAAADRAAARLAGTMPAAAAAAESMDTEKRMEALEALLQDYIEERRRGEEVTGGILRTIEEALTRIVDRVDAFDAAKSAPTVREEQDHPPADDGLDIEGERLAQAYAAGARVLGQARAESGPSILDATDYTPFGARDDDGTASGDAGGQAATKVAQPPSEGHTKPAAPSGGPRPSASAGASRARVSSVLAVILLLLFGTSYLLVDVYLTEAQTDLEEEQPAASRTIVQPDRQSDKAPDPAAQPRSASDTSQPGRAAPADGRPGATEVVPQTPDVVTDGIGEIEPDPSWRTSSSQASGQPMAAFATAALATLPDARGELMAQGRTLLGRDHPRLLPTAIGPAALRNAAAGGDPDAAFEVAMRYAEGRGVTQDLKQAFAWYQRAAAQGHASAQFRVAAFYERGIAVGSDRERAVTWYRRAAEQGHVKAMHNLAVLLAGKGSEPADYAGAARWFREAAERGLPDSQYNLAALCEDGHGVARSLTEAYKWYALAARSGDRGAALRLAHVKGRLNAGELASAEEMVAAWRMREASAAVDATASSQTR
jgi:localization factor PodJL